MRAAVGHHTADGRAHAGPAGAPAAQRLSPGVRSHCAAEWPGLKIDPTNSRHADRGTSSTRSRRRNRFPADALRIGLVVDDGTIRLEQWPPEDRPDSRHYMVLDASGALLRHVVLYAPLLADRPRHITERFVVGVIRDPETEVERVVRFDVPWDRE